MRHLSRVWPCLAAGLLLSAASCDEDRVECEVDGDCDEGDELRCTPAGECVTCLEDAHCPGERLCAADNECRLCGPLPDDPTCGVGLACVGEGNGRRCIHATVVDALQSEGLVNMHEVVTDPHKAGIEAELRAADAVTLFAPGNGALAGLSPDCYAALDDDPARWALLARHHVLFDAIAVSRGEMEDGVDNGPLNLPMQSNATVELADDDGLMADGHRVGRPIEAANGWVHVLDEGLLLTADLAGFGCVSP